MPHYAIRNAIRRPTKAHVALLIAALLAGATAPASAQPRDLLGETAPAPGTPQGQTQGQTQGPKSLLPEGFDTPPPAIVIPVRPAPRPAIIDNDSEAGPGDLASALETTDDSAEEAETPPDPLAELAGPGMQPEAAGLLQPATGGYAAGTFAASDGPFLAALLGRIDAPLASHWAQITLQRALLSRAAAPRDINPSDWVAARASALLALGSGADAHRLVSAIAIDRYTVPLFEAALRAALAAADPVALCPLSPAARDLIRSATWQLVDAMCLSILGDDISATAIFDDLRRRRALQPFDIGLAERLASTISGGRRGANPEWGEVKQLTVWRLGLASAAGLEIPAELLDSATPRVKAWAVRLPGLPLESRARLAPVAAATGAFSSAEIDRLLAAAAAEIRDTADTRTPPGGEIRAANLSPDTAERVAAMRRLWESPPTPNDLSHYGWQVATAAAAARLTAHSALAEDAAAIAESLNAAGILGPGDSWWQVTSRADSSSRAALWARLVAVSDAVPAESELFERWAGSASRHRRELLAAGLQGLGRGDMGVSVPVVENDWTRALDQAVQSQASGEALILIAIGLKGSWAEVPPDYLRRIAAALVAIGHQTEARLIVAEAAARG